MEQMNVPEEMKVAFDFEAEGVPRSARALRPLVFRDDQGYCCLLGPDPEIGIFGCGDTAAEAVSDWAHQLNEQQQRKQADPDTLRYINDVLNTSKNDVW